LPSPHACFLSAVHAEYARKEDQEFDPQITKSLWELSEQMTPA
jgi:hypothetical protein